LSATSQILRTPHRWTTSFLLLVMLVPTWAPLALAGVSPPGGMHCNRRPLAPEPAPGPVMHCHHGALQSQSDSARQPSASAESPKASFSSRDCCCQNCDCCHNSKISRSFPLLSKGAVIVSLVAELLAPSPIARRISTSSAGRDTARAPPRG